MLKSFYKIFFTSILCGSLMLLNFEITRSHFGIHFNVNSSYAASETLKTDGIGGDDMMSTLTMTAIGLLTSRLYQCKLTTDMMIAAAAGAAYLAGDIVATLQLKKSMKDLETQISRMKDGELDQKQIEVLIKLKQSYEQDLDTLDTKKSLQTAAAAAFALAAIMSGIQAYQQTAADVACTTALTAAATTCAEMAAAAAATVGGSAIAAVYAAGGAGAAAAVGTEQAEAASALAPGVSSAKQAENMTEDTANQTVESTASGECPAVSPAAASCTSGRSIKMLGKGVCMTPPVVGSNSLDHYYKHLKGKKLISSTRVQKKKLISLLQNIFLSDAHADLFSPLGIASSSAISFVLATSATLGVQLDTMLFSPFNRAVIWGVLGALVMSATSSTEKQMGIVRGNISKIDAIINGMKSFANGVATNNGILNSATGQIVTINTDAKIDVVKKEAADINVKAMGGAALPCITGDGSKTCTSFSEKLNGSLDLKTLPPSVKTQISSLNKLVDGLNGKETLSRGTISEAQSFGSQAQALSAEAKKKQKELQAFLDKNKIKIDLSKRADDFQKGMNDIVKKNLNDKKMSASEMIASIQGGALGAEGHAISDAITNASASKLAGAGVKVKSSYAIPAPMSAVQKLRDEKILTKSDEESDKDKSAAIVASLNKNSSNLNKNDLKNDISSDQDVSLFELITKRYQKSAYQRLFERIK